MKLLWTKRASRDLEAVELYIEKDNPIAAAKAVQRIIETVEILLIHPEIGRPGRIIQTRELIINGTPYIVPYRICKNAIEILRVFHGAMKWPEKFK